MSDEAAKAAPAEAKKDHDIQYGEEEKKGNFEQKVDLPDNY